MVNFSGVAAIGSALLRPGLVVPHLVIPDIRSLSWVHAKRLGFDYIVFDKDNCITAPHSDSLHPSLEDSYRQCLQVFGEENVLIVSNSAGSSSDVGGVGAQHLSRMLYGTTVLCHPKKKPAKGCARQVIDYFSQVHDPSSSTARLRPSFSGGLKRVFATQSTTGNEGEVVKRLVKKRMGNILVIGDRITTDTVTSHRMGDVLAKRYPSQGLEAHPPQAISVITTTLWANEGPMNMLMRREEASVRSRLVTHGVRPGGGWKQAVGSPPGWDGLLEQQQRSAPASQLLEPSLSSQTLLSDPTPSTYIASQLQRSSLPPWASNILTILVSNRLLGATSRFLRDGWLLILRGCREGLNRPSLVFDESKRRGRFHSTSAVSTPSYKSLRSSRSQQPARSYSTLVAGRSGIASHLTSPPHHFSAYSTGPMTKARTGEVKDEGISAFRVQLVDSETGKLVGEPRNPKVILAEIDRTHYYLLQVTRDQEVPIVKVMSKKDAYLKSKASGGGAGKTVASQPPAEVQISWLVTEHDLSHKLESGKRHLSKKGPGSRVSITITTKKGRKWTSGQEEDKLAVVKKIEDLMMATDTGAAGEGSAPAVRVRRKGDVKWVEPNKVGATIVFEAYK